MITAIQIGNVFKVNEDFWYCTDVGTRTITAIKLHRHGLAKPIGPPYSEAEIVFDENDYNAIELTGLEVPSNSDADK